MRSTKENSIYNEKLSVNTLVDTPWTGLSNTEINYTLDKVTISINTTDNHIHTTDNIPVDTILTTVYTDNTIDDCKVEETVLRKTNLYDNSFSNEFNNGTGLNGTVTVANNHYTHTAHESPTVFNIGNTVYSCGGIGADTNLTDTIGYARMVNGVIGKWYKLDINLPIPLINFKVAITETKIYLIGGTTISGDVNRNIYIGNIDEFDLITEWSLSNVQLPNFISKQIVMVSGNKISLIGGFNSNTNSVIDKVYTSTINENGTLGAFIISAVTLPYQIDDSVQSMVYENNFYIFGNNVDTNLMTTLYIGTIENNAITVWNNAPDIFPSTRTEMGIHTYRVNDTIYVFSPDKLYKLTINTNGDYTVVESDDTINLEVNGEHISNYSIFQNNSMLYFIGGVGSTSINKDIRYIDISKSIDCTNTLINPVLINKDTYFGSVVIAGDELFSIGGYEYIMDSNYEYPVNEINVNQYISKASKDSSGMISGWEDTSLDIGVNFIVMDTLVLNSNIYVFGYYGTNDSLSILNINISDVNNIQLDENITIKSPVPRMWGLCAIYNNGRIIVTFMEHDNGIRLYEYSVDGNGLLTVMQDDVPGTLSNTLKFATNDSILEDIKQFTKDDITFSIGGYDNFNNTYSDVIKYTIYDGVNYTPVSEHVFKLPEPMVCGCIILDGDNLYIIGGQTEDGASDKIYRTTVKNNSFEEWELMSVKLPYGVINATPIVTDNYIYLYNEVTQYDRETAQIKLSNSVTYLTFDGWHIPKNKNILVYNDLTVSGLSRLEAPKFVYYNSNVDVNITTSQTEESYQYLPWYDINVMSVTIDNDNFLTSITVTNDNLFIGEEIMLDGFRTNITNIENIDGNYVIHINKVKVLNPSNVSVKLHQVIHTTGTSSATDKYMLVGERNNGRVIVGDKVVINNNTYREILAINEVDNGNGGLADEFTFASVIDGITSMDIISKTVELRVISKTYNNGIFKNKYNDHEFNGYVIGRTVIASNDKVDIQIPFISELYI